MVKRRFWKVEVAVDVAVMEPTVRFPTDEDEVMEPPYNRRGEVGAEYTRPEREVGLNGQAKVS